MGAAGSSVSVGVLFFFFTDTINIKVSHVDQSRIDIRQRKQPMSFDDEVSSDDDEQDGNKSDWHHRQS